MKKLALLLASAIALGVSLPVNAEMKVGFLSDEKMSSFLREETKSRLTDEFAASFAKLSSEEKAISDRKKNFEILSRQKGKNPTRAEQQEFDSATQKLELELPEKKKKLNEDYRKRENEEASKLKASAMKTISNLGKQEKFTAIFSNSATLYVDPSCGRCGIIDITDNVIKAMSSAP